MISASKDRRISLRRHHFGRNITAHNLDHSIIKPHAQRVYPPRYALCAFLFPHCLRL